MSEILRAVFASGGNRLIPGLKIASEGQTTVYFTMGFEDVTVQDENGDTVTFRRSGMSMGLPGVSNNGDQSVSFGIDNVTGEAQEFVWNAIQNRKPINISLYTYLESDLTQPQEGPLNLQVTGAEIKGTTVTFTGSYLDLMNIQYPRIIYDTTVFPALQFISKSTDL